MAQRKVHLQVYGEVQGVGYRAFAEREGCRLGLSGYVRNCSDGSVEVGAEGPAELLREFVDRLKHGPGRAIVRSILEEWGEPAGGTRGFHVRL